MTEALCFLDPLRRISGVTVGFIPRIPEVEVDGERDEVLERLRPFHEDRVEQAFGRKDWWTAEQVHGNEVAAVTSVGRCGLVMAGADGLVTAEPGAVLGVYVADCGAIWLADRVTGAVGLLHSGKKGTAMNIVGAGLERMSEAFGTRAADVVAVLGPCIRPPHYEVDFAKEIRRQAETAGVAEFHDSGINTAANLDAYYSYRMEKGRTGRMLALIMRGGEASSIP